MNQNLAIVYHTKLKNKARQSDPSHPVASQNLADQDELMGLRKYIKYTKPKAGKEDQIKYSINVGIPFKSLAGRGKTSTLKQA